MHVIRRRGWEIPEHRATPEHVFLNRRALLGAAAGAAAATLVPQVAAAQRVTDIPDPTKDLYPAKRNEKYTLGDRPITPEEINGNYNNFYEFGGSKNIAKAAQALAITRGWRKSGFGCENFIAHVHFLKFNSPIRRQEKTGSLRIRFEFADRSRQSPSRGEQLAASRSPPGRNSDRVAYSAKGVWSASRSRTTRMTACQPCDTRTDGNR
jgi:hypothetical protein